MKWKNLMIFTISSIIFCFGCDDKIDVKFEDTEMSIRKEVLKNVHEYFQLPDELVNSMDYDQNKIEKLVRGYYKDGKSDSLKIYFCSGFDSVMVKVKIEEQILFDKQISTVPILGFAESTLVNKPEDGKFSVIQIKSREVKLSRTALKKYDLLLVSCSQDRLTLEYRNRIPVFY